MVLSQGRVSLKQRLGTALQTAVLLIISLSLSLLFLKSDLLDHWRILYHTHTSRLPRLSSPGLGSLLNHLAEHSVVYWANWIPQYQNQKMLSSINRLPPAYCTRHGKTLCGWPRPVSSRSAKLPGWRSPPIVTIVTIARDMAKQPQLKNQLTKSHESSLPTIGRDSAAWAWACVTSACWATPPGHLSTVPACANHAAYSICIAWYHWFRFKFTWGDLQLDWRLSGVFLSPRPIFAYLR